MASLYKRKNGCYEISFIHPLLPKNRNRKTMRLGQLRDSKKKAETAARDILKHVNELIDAKGACDRPKKSTREWVDKIRVKDTALHNKLAKAGLVQSKEPAVTLGSYLTNYMESRMDWKESTRDLYRQTASKLTSCLGRRIPLCDINAGHGESFRIYLGQQLKGFNTIRNHIARAKTFFNGAVDSDILPSNPFRKLKSATHADEDRSHYITTDIAYRVINECPDAMHRLIFALSRFGGLRCPSEVMSLKWSNVYWDSQKIKVISPKTERFLNGKSRIIPLFPELYQYLRDGFELAEDGAEFVISNRSLTAPTLHSRFHRFIERAGLDVWPKLFMNCRSSRQTELQKVHPLHVVCRWMGNTEKVANKHYLQVTDEDFAIATGEGAAQSAAARPCKAVHERQSHEAKPHISPPCTPMHIPARPANSLPASFDFPILPTGFSSDKMASPTKTTILPN